MPSQPSFDGPALDDLLDETSSERSHARRKSVRWSVDVSATAQSRPQLFGDELTARTLMKHAAEQRSLASSEHREGNENANANNHSSGKPALGRRYSVGSSSYKHMQHELSATNRHHEVDLNASLDLELHRSISRLFESDDEDDGTDEGPTSSSASSIDDGPTLAVPRLARHYSIGVESREHLMYDIHASHQLDLHESLYAPKRVYGGPQDWLVEVDKARKAKACKASATSPPSPPVGRASSPTAGLATPPRAASPADPSAADSDDDCSSVRDSPTMIGAASPAAVASGSPPPLQRFATYERHMHSALEQSFMEQLQQGQLSGANVAAAYSPQQHSPQLQPFSHMNAAATPFALPVLGQPQQPMTPPQGLPSQWQMFQMAQQQAYQQQLYQQQQAYLQQQQQQQLAAQQQAAAVNAQYMQVNHLGFPMAGMPQAVMPLSPAMGGRPGSPAVHSPNMMGSPNSAAHVPQHVLQTGRLVAMAKEQDGSRTLQRALSTMSPVHLQAACDELGPHLGELAVNLFGNYLVSSMAALPEAQPWVERALKGRVVEMMKHAQGSRVVQAALDALPSKTATRLVEELTGQVAATAMSINGSWSVCTAFKVTRAPFIVCEIAESIGVLSTQQSGSRAVQKILPEAASHDVDTRCVLTALIAAGTDELARLSVDQYGNYVVQHALRIALPKPREELTQLLLPALPQLATSKAGSNVAEAVIGCATAEQLTVASNLLLGSGIELATHCFGKHVIAALNRCK